MSHSQFSGLRQVFWPIHRHEVIKLVPLLVMSFLICFNYTVLKILKDTMIIRQGDAGGGEVLAFLKVYGVLPAAVAITALYAIMVRHMSQRRVMILMILGFLAFYNVFSFLIFPYRDDLHWHQATEWIMSFTWMPTGARSCVAMLEYWSSSLFYIAAELWSTMILSVLFWGFANEITKLREAPRFYPVIGVFSSLATFVAGWAGGALTLHTYNPSLPFGRDPLEQSLMLFVILVTLSGLAATAIYYWMSIQHRTNPLLQGDPEHMRKDKHAKETFTFTQSVRYLARSPYLRDVAILVIGYNLVNSVCEVVWKDQTVRLYPVDSVRQAFNSEVAMWTGLLAAGLALVVPFTLRKQGWTFTAMITPVILLVTGIAFFAPFFGSTSILSALPHFVSSTPLLMIVYMGALQNILSRGSKYSIFDATKEMAFIPLNQEARLKGKAAIDGVSSRLGKSGGMAALQVLIICFGTLERAVPLITLVIAVTLISWLIAVRRLGGQFARLQEESQAEGPLTDPMLVPVKSEDRATASAQS